jgi:hypothetical protein
MMLAAVVVGYVTGLVLLGCILTNLVLWCLEPTTRFRSLFKLWGGDW